MARVRVQNHLFLGVRPARPLSPAKCVDIARVAQRMFDEKGVVYTIHLYTKCRSRIPGTFESYGASLTEIVRHKMLKPRRFRKAL